MIFCSIYIPKFELFLQISFENLQNKEPLFLHDNLILIFVIVIKLTKVKLENLNFLNYL